MAELIEFDDDTGIVVEVKQGSTGGVGPVGAKDEMKVRKVAKSFAQSLGMVREVGRSVSSTLKDAGVDEAEVRIGFKASGTGQFIIAATTVEAAIDVTFKVRAQD